MGILENQETWVPYETTKDCSQGFCSIYCPQWCYIIFPPPPPLGLDDDAGSGTPFSPLVIAIIGILASAFLLVSYYTIVSKYCGTFDALRRRLHHRPSNPDSEPDVDGPSQSRRHETSWHVSPSNGLDETLINKITMYRYQRGEGLVDGTDCSVCLGEFQEDESLRLLPKCSHAFHLQCIDTWLKSHSNCPLCRANIMSTASPVPQQLPSPPPPPPEPATNPPTGEAERNDEMVIVIEDMDRVGGEEESNLENECDTSKDSSHLLCDSGGPQEGYDIIEIGDDGGVELIKRSFSMDSSHHGRVSIADVLQMSMEDELMAAKDQGLFTEAGSSRCGGEHSKSSSRSRGLHCVMSPVPMKRSFSSGRFCFTRHGRGRNAVLPI